MSGPPAPVSQRLVPYGDGLDLHHGVLGQTGDLHSAAGRGIAGEESGVDLVHGGEVVHVLEEHRGFDDVVHGQPRLGQDGLNVGQGLLCLTGDAALGEGAGGRVDGELAGGDDDTAAVDGLGVGTDGRRGGSGGNDCFHGGFLLFFEMTLFYQHRGQRSMVFGGGPAPVS